MAHKDFRFEIKEVTEEGTFFGSASVFGNVDMVNEVVEPGAFKRTIDRMGNTFPLLWQHKTAEPIGVVEVIETGNALECKGQLVLEVARAREALALLRARACRGMSVGYRVIKDGWVGKIRHLKELALGEVSIVTIPANPEAQIFAVKSENDRAAAKAAIATLSALLGSDGDEAAPADEGSEEPVTEPTPPASQELAKQVDDPPALPASSGVTDPPTKSAPVEDIFTTILDDARAWLLEQAKA